MTQRLEVVPPGGFGGLLCDARADYGNHDVMQLHCMKALNHVYSYRYPEGFVLPTQHVKDLIRLMRSNFRDIAVVSASMNLLGNLLRNQVIRRECIEYGVLQFVARAVHLHRWEVTEFSSRTVTSIVNSIASESDVRRYVSVLEALVNLSAQLSSTDMEPFIDSLELCCSVVAALSSTTSLRQSLVNGDAVNLIVSVLQNAIQSANVKEQAQFVRVAKSCFYGLTSIVKSHRSTLAFSTQTTSLYYTEQEVADLTKEPKDVLMTLKACGGLEAIPHCLEKALLLKYHDGVMFRCGCTLICTIMSAYPCTTVEFVQAGWIPTAVSILDMESGRDAGDMKPSTTTDAIVKTFLLAAIEEPDCAQHMMKAGALKSILDKMDNAIVHRWHFLDEISYDLLMKALEILAAAASDMLSDRLLFRSFRHLRDFLRKSAFSLSPRLESTRKRAQVVVELLATDAVLRRLAESLNSALGAAEAHHRANASDVVEDKDCFVTLEATFLSSRPKELLRDVVFHKISVRLAALADQRNDDEQANISKFESSELQELACLSSQVLNSSHRESIFTSTTRYFSGDIPLKSLTWMHPDLPECEEGEQSVRFLMEQIIRRCESQEFESLPVLLEALTYYVTKVASTKDVIQSSPLVKPLQNFLCSIVQLTKGERIRIDMAIAALDTVAALLVELPAGWFPLSSGGGDEPHEFVSCCLQLLTICTFDRDETALLLDNGVEELSFAGCKDSAMAVRLIRSSSVILRACLELGAEYARVIIHNPVTKHLLENHLDASKSMYGPSVLHWFLNLLSSMISSHGLLFAEKLLDLLAKPVELLLQASELVLEGETGAMLLSWRSFADCIAISSDSAFSSGGQLDDVSQMAAAAKQAEAFMNAYQSTVDGKLPNLDMYIVEKHVQQTLARYAVILVRWSQQQQPTSSNHSALAILKVIDRSALAHCELFVIATGFRNAEAKIAALHLNLARIAAQQGLREDQDFVAEVADLHLLMRVDWVSDEALAAYLNLATAVYLSSYSSQTLDFLDSSSAVLKRAICHIAVGNAHAAQLYSRVSALLQSLCSILNEHWENVGVTRILRFYQAFATTSWSRTLLLSATFSLYKGVGRLLEIASASTDQGVRHDVILFLHQNLSELRHKTQRIDELELRVLLDVINYSSSTSPPPEEEGCDDSKSLEPSSHSEIRSAFNGKPSSKVLRAALEVLKDLIRIKHCATICCSLKGFEVLYQMMSSSSPHQTAATNLLLGLEICCYLTAHEENLRDPILLSLAKLIFIIVDAHTGLANYSRLGFLIIDQCISLHAPIFTAQSLVQQCHTQLLSWKAYHAASAQVISEEVGEAIRKLYDIQATFAGPPPPALKLKKPSGFFESSSKTTQTTEFITKNSILSCCSVVKCQSGVDGKIDGSSTVVSYVDMKTSMKSFEEPESYKELCGAVYQLKFLLHDTELVLDDEYTLSLLAPLSGIVLQHSITSDLVCHAMEILAQISFLRPAIVVNHSMIDFRALATCCILHEHQSLPFAVFASVFCDNIAAQSHTQPVRIAEPMLDLVFALLKTWKEDLDVVQTCISALRVLLRITSDSASNNSTVNGDDRLALLNGAFQSHAHDISITWNCLQCVLQLVPETIAENTVALKSIEFTLTTLLGTLRAYTTHVTIAESALKAIERIYRYGKLQFARRQLIDLGATQFLVCCIESHVSNERIVMLSMRLLLSALSSLEHFDEVLAQVVINKGHIVIPTVCRASVNEEQICALGTQILMRMIDVQDGSFRSQARATDEICGDGIDNDEEETKESDVEKLRWRNQVLQELLSADILSLLFHLLDNYQVTTCKSKSVSFVGMLLEMLYDLTRTDHGRDLAEALHALEYLQRIVNVVWLEAKNPLLLESAVDCLVNLACANRQLHGWSELPMWLLHVAKSIQSKCSLSLCLEKIIGILNRLAVHTEMGNQLAYEGAHLVLQLVAYAEEGDDNALFVEQSVFTLMCQLCHESRNIPIFIMFDAIPITIDRVSLHVDDEDCLYACIQFLVVLAGDKESSIALQDEQVYLALRAVTAKYEYSANKSVYHLAQDLLELLGGDASKKQQQELNAIITTASTSNFSAEKKPSALPRLSQLELTYRDLLLEGAVFRLWLDLKKKVRQKQKQIVRITAAATGSYLLFQHLSSKPQRIERVFLSQVKVLPSPSDIDVPASATISASKSLSPEKKSKCLLPFLKRAVMLSSSASMKADCRFHLMVRGELLSLEASSGDERRMWEQALKWLVLHHADGVFVTN